MSSETRYPFILNLDTGESQWSVNAVRDFDLPSQHPFNSLDMWLARVHPEDRDNVRAELDMVINSTWHFHYMQYRVMDATGTYVLCDCTGYRLDGTDTEPSMYVGIIVNRSLADTTDSVTGLGDIHALVNAIGECVACAQGWFIAIKIDDIAQVNARFGFDAGDRVFAECAACLVECSRGKGRMFRSTGPMFVALFDELWSRDTDEIAEEIERFLGSPVLIGPFEYQPPIRVATLHLDGVDRQPVSILNELKALLERGTCKYRAPNWISETSAHRAPLPYRAIILRRSHQKQREFVMKVLLINGSPKANGNTARALAEIAEQAQRRRH